jgi:hypothetical protein
LYAPVGIDRERAAAAESLRDAALKEKDEAVAVAAKALLERDEARAVAVCMLLVAMGHEIRHGYVNSTGPLANCECLGKTFEIQDIVNRKVICKSLSSEHFVH